MDTVNRKNNEKRNFLRMEVDTPAELLIRGKGLGVKGKGLNAKGLRDKALRGLCRDLSGSGMLVEVEASAGEELESGLELEVKLASHYGDSPMLKAHSRVARITRNQQGRLVVGLEILEILD